MWTTYKELVVAGSNPASLLAGSSSAWQSASKKKRLRQTLLPDFYVGRNSVEECLTVTQVVAGSIPVDPPNSLASSLTSFSMLGYRHEQLSHL